VRPIRPLAVVTAILLLATSFTVLSPAAHANIPVCRGTWTIQANNGLYVAAELDSFGMLRARTPGNALGSWERFRLFEHGQSDGTKFWALQAANGLYVVAEDYSSNYPGRLMATFYWPTPYNYPHRETLVFREHNQLPPNGSVTQFRLSYADLWVANEENGVGGAYPGMLRARTPGSQLGGWENFIWRRVSTSCV
jgi:hypothetical protein